MHIMTYHVIFIISYPCISAVSMNIIPLLKQEREPPHLHVRVTPFNCETSPGLTLREPPRSHRSPSTPLQQRPFARLCGCMRRGHAVREGIERHTLPTPAAWSRITSYVDQLDARSSRSEAWNPAGRDQLATRGQYRKKKERMKE